MNMPFILAIEPDPRQAAVVRALAGSTITGELLLVDSIDGALEAIERRVPDLLLTSLLLSPKDDAALTMRLRSLDTGPVDVQTLVIPVLASSGTRDNVAERSGGLLSRLLKGRTDTALGDGCDPQVFAAQVNEYLARAESERREREVVRDRWQEERAAPVSAPMLQDLIPVGPAPELAHDAFAWDTALPAPQEHAAALDIELQVMEPVAAEVPEHVAVLEEVPQPVEALEPVQVFEVEVPEYVEATQHVAALEHAEVTAHMALPEHVELPGDEEVREQVEFLPPSEASLDTPLAATLNAVAALPPADVEPAFAPQSAIAEPGTEEVATQPEPGADETVEHFEEFEEFEALEEFGPPLLQVHAREEAIAPQPAHAPEEAIAPTGDVVTTAVDESGLAWRDLEPFIEDLELAERLAAVPTLPHSDVDEPATCEPPAADELWMALPSADQHLMAPIEGPAIPSVVAPAGAEPQPVAPLPAPPKDKGRKPARSAVTAERPGNRRRPARPRPSRATAARKPMQDEWGLYDPEQCGFAALLERLESITQAEADERKSRDRSAIMRR
jgi:hypothetical protein